MNLVKKLHISEVKYGLDGFATFIEKTPYGYGDCELRVSLADWIDLKNPTIVEIKVFKEDENAKL